jgi:nitrogen fixation protein FixH
MAISKKNQRLIAIFGVFAGATLAIASYASVALFEDQAANSELYPGTVGLRSYFQKGTGTEADPFVISRPMHFYNLTRLQNLGILNSRLHFSLGYDPDGGTNLRFYKNDSGSDMQNYLDMSSYDSVETIGTEGSPFYGVFNGNNKEIYGLKVKSGPEDVGIFGYTYSGSMVENVYFNNPTITDNGYDTNVDGVEALYTSASGANMTYTSGSTTYDLATTVTTDQPFSDLTGTFHCPLPTTKLSGVSYEWRASSGYFTMSKNNDGSYTMSVNDKADDADKNYYSIANNATFTGAATGTVLNTRVSLVASVFQEGVFYSKVLTSYKVSFINNLVGGVSTIKLRAIQDYVNPADKTDTTYTEYAHGVNIGYLIGHCDGSISSCYVFGGTLSMNNTLSKVVPMAQETETGLIGEVGCSLSSEFTPQNTYDQSGDTGVVNFTKLYSDIRGSSVTGTYVNENGGYYNVTLNAGTSDKYLDYLRTDFHATPNYVSSAGNAVDFRGRVRIADTPASEGASAVNRNLGVFSLITSDWPYTGGGNFFAGLGEFAVTHETFSYSDFYYTTAEWQDLDGTRDVISDWGEGYDKTHHLIQPLRLPSYCDDSTWEKNLEEHFNFIFRCDLNSDATSNYFYNTDSAFLQKYFSYKLVSKAGSSVPVGSKNFGIFVKNVDLEEKKTTNIASLNASLKLSAPSGNDTIPTLTLDSTTYATKTIDFSIANDTGANVTVLAASTSSSGGYVGIYDKSKALASSFNKTGKYANQHPNYAMYVGSSGYYSNPDYFVYHTYDYSTGATSLAPTIEAAGARLYAHTFKLPKGEYFIASPNGDASIYYVCAQGQDKGNYGNEATLYAPFNTIANVDFISKGPRDDGFLLADDRCWLSFEGKFSSATGSVVVSSSRSGTTNSTSINQPANLTSLLIYNQKNQTVVYNGTTYTTTYIQDPAS